MELVLAVGTCLVPLFVVLDPLTRRLYVFQLLPPPRVRSGEEG